MVLFDEQSALQRVVVTDDGEDLRAMMLGKRQARQSVIRVGDPTHLEVPLARVAIAGFAVPERLERALIIGLGGGAVPRFLAAVMPDLAVDVVELDPVVVEAATRFCDLPSTANLAVHVGDGREWLERCEARYDAIYLDAYDGRLHGMPWPLMTEECLLAARRALAPGGVLLANVWTGAHNRWFDDMIATYQRVFESLLLIDVPGSPATLFTAMPAGSVRTRRQVRDRVRWFCQAHALPFDLHGLVRNQVHGVVPSLVPGTVLRDAAFA